MQKAIEGSIGQVEDYSFMLYSRSGLALKFVGTIGTNGEECVYRLGFSKAALEDLKRILEVKR